jgi:hypothetical protein
MVDLIFKLVVAAVFGFVVWKLVPMLTELPRDRTYNCSIAEISPDYPPAVREQCRKLQK